MLSFASRQPRWAMGAGVTLALGCSPEPSTTGAPSGSTPDAEVSTMMMRVDASSSPPPDVEALSQGDDGAAKADATAAPADGSPSTSGEAGPQPAPCSAIEAVLFCDDFESGLSSSLVPRMLMGGTIAVDSTRARGGKGALHVKSPMVAYSDAEVSLGKPVFPTSSNSFFMRAFVYYARPAAADNVYLFRLDGVLPNTKTKVNGQMGAEGYPYDQPNAPNFKHLSTLIYHSDITTADHVSYRNPMGQELPYDRWACWEWQVDGTGNAWRLWIDGVEQFVLTWNGDAGAAWIVPSATTLSIGIRHPHDQTAAGVEVWFDDLAIAGKRIGCGLTL